MNFITKFFIDLKLARIKAKEDYLRRLANASPSYEWLIVRAGTSEQSRSPMLTTQEVRAWFREEFPNGRVCHIDNDNKIIFYE